ncbi:phage integrase SAM-like domain-containing protein [uncultured Marinobacter sp.]|uniref:phage integrase SAM-like domain-containing protein n=1 Tax=uncultured Marinobacter sp. TaxID=187379 RepID=UPI0025977515|nr:phage integrase SAM-like domain-containing protein [uncultured Marinobacter sp.]|tara:strand:- start:2674 stop:4320 length:1647 start_codon:yes stop_codon:yes gene_type:complete
MKKDFTLEGHESGVQEAGETATEATTTTINQTRLSKPANTVVAFPENPTTIRTADFGQFYGQGYDDITAACQRTIEKLIAESVKTKGKSLSLSTIVKYWNSGFRYFAPFLSLLHTASGERLRMADLNADSIKQYLQYLRNEPVEYVSQKSYFANTKALLGACHRFGFWPEADIKAVWPANPFPNSNKRVKGQKALSKNEKRFMVKAMRKDMERIVSHSEPLSSYDLTVCVLSISLSTGMNLTPILELTTDCVQPHPLKSNLRLLVSFKRRGNATQVVALRKSEEVSEMASIHLYAADAIDLIVTRNATTRAQLDDPNRLLVFKRTRGKYVDKPCRLTSSALNYSIKAFVDQHQLQTDDGKPLALNVSRLRQTLLNRIWEMSGQDPLMTARTGRHAVETGNAHYWEAPPEAETNMRFLGEARVEELLSTPTIIASDRTPVASCENVRRGHRAPKDGEPCQDYLGCFRCKSFVVTGDDLYRLFSFYWAALRNYDTFGGKRWAKYLKQVVRLIDEEIAPHFDAILVSKQRERAKHQPHPFWRDLSMARMAI